MFQKQVDDLIGDFAGILKHDRTHWRFPTPVPRLLATFAGDSQRIHRVGQCGICPLPLIQSRECQSGNPMG